jgi:hypothetical protein
MCSISIIWLFNLFQAIRQFNKKGACNPVADLMQEKGNKMMQIFLPGLAMPRREI